MSYYSICFTGPSAEVSLIGSSIHPRVPAPPISRAELRLYAPPSRTGSCAVCYLPLTEVERKNRYSTCKKCLRERAKGRP